MNAPRRRPTPWLKPSLYVGFGSPLAVIAVRAAGGDLSAEPVAELLNQFGLLALILLIGSLALTPIAAVTGWTWPARIRRLTGVFAFIYALLHFLTYVAVDQVFNLKAVLADVAEREFIAVGFLAFLLLLPLALTSTDAMVRKLGFVRWKRLHRLAYLAGVLAVVHFFWRVKVDLTQPALYAAVLALLLLARVAFAVQARLKKRRRASAAG